MNAGHLKTNNKKKEKEQRKPLSSSSFTFIITVVKYYIDENKKMNHKTIYNNLNQSSADYVGKETVRKLCQLHPKVPGTFEGPKKYILNIPAGKH